MLVPVSVGIELVDKDANPVMDPDEKGMVIAGSIDIGNLVSGDTSIHGGRSYPEMGALRWRPHLGVI